MIGGVNPKILVSLNENGELEMDANQAELLGLADNEFNWRLVREGDGLNKKSKAVMWIEWDELSGRFKAQHDEPAIGRSLIMSPFNHFFTWQTTVITEILELADDLSYIKFRTENSIYELFKL
jgi:hypothetical protein